MNNNENNDENEIQWVNFFGSGTRWASLDTPIQSSVCDDRTEIQESTGYDGIDGYHRYRKSFIKRKIKGEKPKYYIGFELEVYNKENKDNGKIAGYIRKNLDKKHTLIFANDSSIGGNGNGFEIISDPMSYNYFITNFNTYSTIFDFLISNGYVSDKAKSCGLHFHISRTVFARNHNINANIEKLLLFFETYKDEIERFARRKSNHYSHFLCDSTDYDYDDENDIVEDKKIRCNTIKIREKCNNDRYEVVNLDNNNTIELRIFKGTLNKDTFLATYEFVNNIAKVIPKTKLEQISFDKVVYCNNNNNLIEYATSRGARNDAKLIDYGKEEKEMLLKEKRKYKLKINNTYKKIFPIIENMSKILREEENRFRYNCINIISYNYHENIENDDIIVMIDHLIRILNDAKEKNNMNKLIYSRIIRNTNDYFRKVMIDLIDIANENNNISIAIIPYAKQLEKILKEEQEKCA